MTFVQKRDYFVIISNKMSGSELQRFGSLLPTPGEAKAKAMPGRLYIATTLNNEKQFQGWLY